MTWDRILPDDPDPCEQYAPLPPVRHPQPPIKTYGAGQVCKGHAVGFMRTVLDEIDKRMFLHWLDVSAAVRRISKQQQETQ